MELELRDEGEVATQMFKANSEKEDILMQCESTRVSHLYPHKECGDKDVAQGRSAFHYCVDMLQAMIIIP